MNVFPFDSLPFPWVQTFVSQGIIRDALAFLLQICMVYVNTLLVQKELSEKEWLDNMQ
jgi:TnpA family transposase